MKDLDKMNLVVKYICECNWTPKKVDCLGDKISMGVDLDTAYLIRDLSILVGKAQVYVDKQEFANYDKVAIEKHDEAPIDRYDNWLFTSLLETKFNKRNFIMLRKNEIETEDSFFATDDTTFNHTMYDYSKH